MVFNFFKSRKLDKYALSIYHVLAPQINLAKDFGKYPDHSTACDYMIDNDYLLSYLNTIINLWLKIEYRLFDQKDCGMVCVKILEMIEPTFSNPIKLERYMGRLLRASKNTKFKKGADDAFMTSTVMFDMQEQEQFKNNKICKEANDYFDNGGFKADQVVTQNLGIPNSGKLGSIPKRFIVAHRILEKTFGKELSAHFKFKNPLP
tara:strand:- start:166 stop:780 length:615 start_codon:yes stop_codon:yes gene_type:complete